MSLASQPLLAPNPRGRQDRGQGRVTIQELTTCRTGRQRRSPSGPPMPKMAPVETGKPSRETPITIAEVAKLLANPSPLVKGVIFTESVSRDPPGRYGPAQGHGGGEG